MIYYEYLTIYCLQFRGKWFAMKFLLDTPISPDKRAIPEAGDSAEQISEGSRDGWSGNTKK